MPFDISATDRNIQALKEPQDLINKVVKEFSESEKVLAEWKRDIVQYYELYAMVQRDKHYEGLADLFVPEILRAVETVTSKLYQLVFGQPDWMQYTGRDNNGDDGPALALTELSKYQCDENGFKARVMDSFRQMAIGGLTVRKIGWDYQEINRIIGMQPGPDGKMALNRQVDTVKDTWTYEPVDLLAFHISDITTPYNDLQKAEWIGEEYTASKNWLKTRTKRKWLSKLMETELNLEVKAPDSQSQQLQNERFRSSGFIDQQGKNGVHLLERWGLIEARYVMSPEEMAQEGYEEDDMVESVIIIGNKKAILKLERNPWYHQQKPYVACPYVPKEFELPGIGVAKISKSLQEEINDTRNQTLDNKTLILSTMWLKSRGSGIKDEDLVIRANGVITTNDMEGLVPLRPPVVAGVGTNMEAIAKDDLRESAGAASNLQGIAQAGVGTATESATINRESMSRLLMIAQLYSELCLKPTFVMAEYLNYQFYDHVKMIRIVGPVGAKYKQRKPDEIAGGKKDVVIKISLDATENPSVLRQQFLNFFTLIQSIPPEMIPFYWKFLDKAFGMFFSGHKLEEVLPNPGIVEPEKLLTPEEERDCCLAEQPVVAKQGQDHQEYIAYHVNEFNQMKMALTEEQFMIYQKLIVSHWQLLQEELAQQAQQMIMAEQAQAQEQAKGPNRGQTKNTSPHNQTKQAPSTASQRREIGG